MHDIPPLKSPSHREMQTNVYIIRRNCSSFSQFQCFRPLLRRPGSTATSGRHLAQAHIDFALGPIVISSDSLAGPGFAATCIRAA
ncbi:hypothetical protein Trco_004313 [Trichoderma cornu-damae]|uniref:Uncharacterized protein n=1 Tax=Trichoderma cornu-damae TaxID=654480 RepID=A0A9P8QKH9_9HYPO|nr:hypothetical protein Trco_004313 [Trichoderma cornu-damae]